MIDERTKQDIIRAANNFNTQFPNSPITYPEMLKRFNESPLANPNSYLAPIYDEITYKAFVQFAKMEIEAIAIATWIPPQEKQQVQNMTRRNQMKNRPMFGEER